MFDFLTAFETRVSTRRTAATEKTKRSGRARKVELLHIFETMDSSLSARAEAGGHVGVYDSHANLDWSWGLLEG